MLEHRLAKLAALATFLLLIVGGTVNPTGSSLACPEAFVVCYGKLFPPLVGGVMYEHGHRLFAMSVGFIQIALTMALWTRRPALRRWGVFLLAFVIAQGLFGATTVYFKLPWLVSTAHLLIGMSYFACLVLTVLRTNPNPGQVEQRQGRARAFANSGGRSWLFAAAFAVLLQVTLGALVRHNEAWLACGDMPLCEPGTAMGSNFLQHLHMLHRTMGVIVAIFTSYVAWQTWQRSQGWSAMRRLAVAIPAIAVVQVILGIYTVLTYRQIPVAVAHFAGAVLLWGTSMSMLFLTSVPRTQAQSATHNSTSRAAKEITA